MYNCQLAHIYLKLGYEIGYLLSWLAGELGQEVGGAGGAAHGPCLLGQRITLQADSLALPLLASQLVGTKDFATNQELSPFTSRPQ
jgi:hypothetical protein